MPDLILLRPRLFRVLFVGLLLLHLLPGRAAAQLVTPTTWTFATSPATAKVGQEVELIFRVKMLPDWYLYSSDFDPNLGPIVTTAAFEPHPSYRLVGKLVPQHPKKKYDDTWGGEYTYFVGTAEFRQKIKVLAAPVVLKGRYEGQSCSEKTGQCVPLDGAFTFSLNITPGAASAPDAQPGAGSLTGAQSMTAKADARPAPADAATITADTKPATADAAPAGIEAKPLTADSVAVEAGTKPAMADSATTTADAKPLTPKVAQTTGEEGASLWTILFTAFAAGLIALLTPCVYPMVPMTVSFFTAGQDSRRRSILKAGFYGASIVFIYTVIGVLVARLLGEDGPNFLATHWAPNLLFFAVFVVFGLSFLGLFEITLPSALVNRADAQADKGGWLGIFFMAFTLVLVSFSCTGPVVGSVLSLAARGQTLAPVVGMLGFGLAFALPFTLFAVFPAWLKGLPKSGNWLNAVKVTLGFLELALSLKFLSVVDQVYHWQVLNRDVFLALWIVLFGLLGLYLLGKLRLSHDPAEAPALGVPRLLIATAALAFTVYLIPGLFGAPLAPLAGWLPPETSGGFSLNSPGNSSSTPTTSTTSTTNALCEAPRYADFLHLPHGLNGYFDLEQARRCARATNKPIFIDFTGHGCVNCREMEARVWADPGVLRRLRENFVVTALYVDDKTDLPAAEQYVSARDGRRKTTIGARYFDLQATRFNANAQPLYVLLQVGAGGPETDRVLVPPRAYNLDVTAFTAYLDEGLNATE